MARNVVSANCHLQSFQRIEELAKTEPHCFTHARLQGTTRRTPPGEELLSDGRKAVSGVLCLPEVVVIFQSNHTYIACLVLPHNTAKCSTELPVLVCITHAKGTLKFQSYYR
eukprot:5542595-Amphidinium_carterae.1